jgi:hypothetical protein
MKTLTILAALALTASFSTAAHADGFTCQTADGSVNVKIYNNTDPSVGTRVAAIMVLSDPSISDGKKTIARFTDVNGTIESRGTTYVANVDLRFNDSSLKGRNFLGTKLNNVDTITADIDFSYNSPVANGEEVKGSLRIARRSGAAIDAELSCVRYLKN